MGQWALIGDKDRRAVSRPRMTNDARWEELAQEPTFRGPWERGQRCIIPADWFDEPNRESGKNLWWRFKRADGDVWGLAELWNDWIEPETGVIHHSYTMLTLNCDGHPLLSRMHKPDPLLPDDEQDKRTVVPLGPADWEHWLTGTVEEADQLRRVPAVEIFDAGPTAR